MLWAGIAEVIGAVGNLIYTISLSSRANFPGAATFGQVVAELAGGLIGFAVIWIAREYVKE